MGRFQVGALALCGAIALLAAGSGLRSGSAQADPAAPAPRLALVIGNAAYGDTMGALENPVHDAQLISAALRDVGFEVVELDDADQQVMKRAIVDFGDRLGGAGGDAVGLFYYAGHGVQADGRNYLIPVGAGIRKEADVDIEAVAADWVLKQMEFAGSAVNIVILDACRNNPLVRGFRSQLSGLAEIVTKPRGSFIAYSTAPGEVAADGKGANSPYATALAASLAAPGLGIEEVFRDVRAKVLAATGERQTPWDSSSLTAPFFFVPEAKAPPKPTAAAGGEANQTELAFWETIRNDDSIDSFQTYLDRYPDGAFAPLASLRIGQLRGRALPPKGSAGPAETPPSPPESSQESPPGVDIDPLDTTYVAVRGANVRAEPDTAAEIVGRLAEDDDVTVTGKVRGKDWYRVTLADERVGYVSAPLLAEVDPLEIGAWQALKAKPTLERVNAFLGAYPDSRYASKAKTLQSKLRSGKKTPSLGPLIEDALLAAQRNPDQPRARNLHDLVQSIAPKPDWLEAAPTKVQAHYQRCLADITVSYLSTAELGVYDAVVRGEADISQFDGNKFERILQSRSGGTQDLRQKFIETCPDDLLDIARYAPQ